MNMRQAKLPSSSASIFKVASLVVIVVSLTGCGPIGVKYRQVSDPVTIGTVVNVQQLHFLSGESFLEIRFQVSNKIQDKVQFDLSPNSRVKSLTCEYEFTQLLIDAVPNTGMGLIEIGSESTLSLRLTYKNVSFEGNVRELRRKIENELLEVSVPVISDSTRFIVIEYRPIVD